MKTAIILIAFFAFILNASAQIKVNADRQLCTTDDYPFVFKVGATMAGYTGNSSNSNVSFGYSSLNNPLTGLDNIAVGYHALRSNTTGNGNVATGSHALYENTSGEYNTVSGSWALYNNTTGSFNVAIGNAALNGNTEGMYNVANGPWALTRNTTGMYNAATGSHALYENTFGEYNTANGTGALISNTTGSYNTAVGSYANVTSGNLNNVTAIGYYAHAYANNQVVIGNYTVTSAGGAVSWSTVSDGRAKRNIAANIPGLEFINRLQPVSYNLDLKAIDELTKSDDPKINAHRDSLQKAMSPEERRITEEARANKESKVYSGFIAQDVEKAAKETGYNFSGVDAPENGKGPYGLRYAEFVVPLVKAVQELSKQNDTKNIAIASLQEQNNNLQKQINELAGKSNAQEAIKSAVPADLPETATGSASLEQNIPNPFNQNTAIKYYLPETVSTAQLCIYDLNGRQLKQITLSGRGEGSQTVQGSQFSPGIYLYALIADGQEVDVKRMILTE